MKSEVEVFFVSRSMVTKQDKKKLHLELSTADLHHRVGFKLK